MFPPRILKIVIPKKFIENEELKGMDQLDKEIDVDQVEDTLNSGGDNSAMEGDANQNPPGQEGDQEQDQQQQSPEQALQNPLGPV